MTREEAIKWFRESPFWHKDHEPFNMAIKALEQEPTTKNDLGVDCISRADVDAVIEQMRVKLKDGRMYILAEVVQDIIRELPSVTPQEPCDKCEVTFKDDNAVSRLSLRDIIYANAYELEYPDGSSEYVVNRDELFKYLMELPSVTPQEPRWIHAKWKQLDNEPDTFFTMHQYECSNCGKIQLAKSKNIKKFRYCSKCGADMRGEKT